MRGDWLVVNVAHPGILSRPYMGDSVNILEALAAQPNARGNKTCVVQRWLDTIDDDTDGKAELVSVVTLTDKRDPDFRTRQSVALILSRLGFDTTADTIGDHRSGRCRCFY